VFAVSVDDQYVDRARGHLPKTSSSRRRYSERGRAGRCGSTPNEGNALWVNWITIGLGWSAHSRQEQGLVMGVHDDHGWTLRVLSGKLSTRRGFSSRIVRSVASSTPARRSRGTKLVIVMSMPGPPFLRRYRGLAKSADSRMRFASPASRSVRIVFTYSSARGSSGLPL